MMCNLRVSLRSFPLLKSTSKPNGEKPGSKRHYSDKLNLCAVKSKVFIDN